ncbi:hypothetical protein JRQ81_017304 [Phrynocephalus forsythii]|uniref:Uncharacterized protein n=1 Tax=Phrynocephalus forsythii TaxID=171643 RepID=A0A9Q1AZI3_9SAUR|nr:hypothetical protein JRQ81_017304 [Phrynocephalus forsythii]
MRRKKSKPSQEAKWVRSAPSDRSLEILQRLNMLKPHLPFRRRRGRGSKLYYEKKLKNNSPFSWKSWKHWGGLSKEIKQISEDCKFLKNEFQALNTKVEKIQADFKNFDQRVTQVEKLAKQNEDGIQKQKKCMEEINKKVIYLEESSRHSNIKIMNFALKKRDNLKEEVISWINTIMKSQFVREEDVERIHFLGSPQIQHRPIILKLFNYAEKKEEEFLRVVRSKPELLSYKGTSVQVYQDLSYETSQWRKNMRPVTAVLIKNNLKNS